MVIAEGLAGLIGVAVPMGLPMVLVMSAKVTRPLRLTARDPVMSLAMAEGLAGLIGAAVPMGLLMVLVISANMTRPLWPTARDPEAGQVET